MFEIVVDEASLRRSSGGGTIDGILFVRLDGEPFPDDRWWDVPDVVLSGWDQVVHGELPPDAELRFMDGSAGIRLEAVGEDLVLTPELSDEPLPTRIRVPAAAVRDEVERAIGALAAACERRGIASEGLVRPAPGDVRYPAIRQEVMKALAVLADVGEQRRARVADERSPGAPYDFDLMVNLLFADNGVLTDPGKAVGAVLRDGDEVAALRRLGDVFGPLLDRLGDVPDTDYLAAPEWAEVTRLAGLALAAMTPRSGT